MAALLRLSNSIKPAPFALNSSSSYISNHYSLVLKKNITQFKSFHTKSNSLLFIRASPNGAAGFVSSLGPSANKHRLLSSNLPSSSFILPPPLFLSRLLPRQFSSESGKENSNINSSSSSSSSSSSNGSNGIPFARIQPIRIAVPIKRSYWFRLTNSVWLLRLAKASIAFLSVGLILGLTSYFASVYLPHDNLLHQLCYKLYIYYLGIIRLLRDLRCILINVADYKYSLLNLSGRDYELKLSEVHARCARRLRNLMYSNGGVYLKFAQHIAQAKYLLPEEYVYEMRDSMQYAPACSYEEVRDTIFEELGAYPEQLFEQFDPKPIASASLAQVHFAVLRETGEEVAVKVQHRFLIHTIAADIAIVDFLVRLTHKLVPDFDYNWLADTVKAKLPQECDFTIEAKNSERCAANFQYRKDVYCPKIYWNLTKPRVLTMERISGAICTDRKGIAEQGIEPQQVSELMAEVFSEMAFEHGFLHADPHEGNVFVRRCAGYRSPQPQLVLLDHGLYVELSEKFRVNYAKLWKALIEANKEEIQLRAQEMGAGELWQIFSGMLTRKDWTDIENAKDLNHLQQVSTQEERLRLRQLAVKYNVEMQKVLARLPLELILLFKTNDCLRYVDEELGTQFNSHIIMARYCIHTINQDNLKKTNYAFSTRIKNGWQILKLEGKILAFETYLSWITIWSKIQSVVFAPARYLRRQFLLQH
jgi:aarF domain-containing kinase